MPAFRRAVDRSLTVGAALIVCLCGGCGKEAPTASPPRPVRSLVVTAASAGGGASYTAEIHSRYETDLAFQVSGKLVNVPVTVGTLVRKGELLAQLDQTDFRVSLEAARSAVTAAQAEFDRARSEEGRYRDLLERGLTTRASHLAQQTSAKTSHSKLDQAIADLRLSEQKLSYTSLRADADGVVTTVTGDAGVVVSAGQRVVTVARPNELEAVFDVPDAHIDGVRASSMTQVALLSSPTTQYPARVREISPMADPKTRTYRVKAQILSPPPNLRLGMNVVVTLTQPEGPAVIALPATALFQKNRDPAVWIVKADHVLELRPVTVARYETDQVFISNGVKAGERIVTAGVHRLSPGEQVRLLTEVRQ
jgi:RND family efflux transporter MFP subunit